MLSHNRARVGIPLTGEGTPTLYLAAVLGMRLYHIAREFGGDYKDDILVKLFSVLLRYI